MPLFLPKIEALGIDLSDRSIKIAKITKRKDKFILEGIGEKEIPYGFINDGIINRDKEEDLIKIIKDVFLESKGEKITCQKAICSLPEENSFIKVIRIPRVTEEELEEAVRWQIEPNFPVRLSDVFFDFQVISEQNEDEIAVCVAAVPKDIVFSYLSIFKKANIEPLVFEVESMSLIRALVTDYLKEPTVFLDMGKCGTGFTVFSGNTILFTSHIEMGGSFFTKSISKTLKVKEDEAEKLKREIGLRALQKRGITPKIKFPITNLVDDIKEQKTKEEQPLLYQKVFDSMVLPLTDAVEQIKKYINYFGEVKEIKGIPSGEIKKIILCGGEARIIGMSEFLAETLNKRVEIANPILKIEVSKKITKEPLPYRFLSFATAIGLAIRGASINYVEV